MSDIKEYLPCDPNYIKFKNKSKLIIMMEVRIMITFCGGNDGRDTKEALKCRTILYLDLECLFHKNL